MAKHTLCSFVLLSIVLAPAFVPSPAYAAVTISGYAFGGEGAAIAGSTIEDFEDVSLVPGLTIRLAGGIPTPTMWSGTLPRTWAPSTASSCCALGGPFLTNTWDGTMALTNMGHGGPGRTGLSPGTGNYWDEDGADSTCFLFDPPATSVGVGLSNFQSLGGEIPWTDHELIVNGVSWGLLEVILPGWIPGGYVRNAYVMVTATAPDVIESVVIQNVTRTDGLVFDKLAVNGSPTATVRSTWGRIMSIYR